MTKVVRSSYSFNPGDKFSAPGGFIRKPTCCPSSLEQMVIGWIWMSPNHFMIIVIAIFLGLQRSQTSIGCESHWKGAHRAD